MARPLQFSYNADTDVITIEGVTYAGEVFRQFGGLLPVGALFRLHRYEDQMGNKTIMITQVETQDIVNQMTNMRSQFTGQALAHLDAAIGHVIKAQDTTTIGGR